MEYIKYRNICSVIEPENYLPKIKSDISSEKHYVIIPKLVRQPIGI